MPNSPTIVSAALSDKELQASINQMVANFDKGLQTMLEHSNEYVGKIQESLQKIGNTNFGAKGSNDGGVFKQTKQHKELTEAVSKETQKLQDLQQSLSGASDREQNFISQKERAAGTIAQENELLQRQEQELANLKNQQSSFSGTNQQTTASIEKQREAVANLKNEVKYWQSIVSQLQSGDKKTRFNNLWIGDTTSKQGHDILDVANKLYSIMQKLGMEAEKGSASTGQAVKVVEQLAKYYKISREEAEKIVMSVQESPLARGKFTTHYDTRFGLDNLTMQKKDAEDSALRLLIAQSKLERQTDDLALANKRLADSENSSTQSSQQKAQIDAQVAAKEKEIAETKGRIAAATKEQSEAEKNASQAAKEKANIQSQVANQEKQVAEAKKQLTTATQQHTEAETKSSRATKEKTMTLDQQASAINTAVQSEKKYTDEVLRQAAAIRSSKEWQEKGRVVVGDVNYYDKERANVSKRDKQLLLSLEEQIVQAQQNEAEAARRAAQETRNQAQAQQQVQQSALGTARIIESVHEMQRRSANFQKGNASVPTFTVELESAKRLSDRLKELREQYNNMNFGQRFGKEGQSIAQQIREITRQGQKLNNELNRPTKKEVFGLSEKTLDDIAYKMRQLSIYRGGLDASKQSKEIAQVNDEYNRLKKRMDEVMQKNQQMIASNTALGRSWNYMKNRLAFYFTVGASTSFIKNLIEVRSQYEMNERALGILVNSAERGTQIFNELSQMALVSPYTLIELSSAAKQLTAYDVAAKDVVDTTRRLADMAAAVGIPIERLTYALGQIKAYGYLNARDARMFANAGIPLVKQLSEYYTELEGRLVSTADIYDRIKKKSIGYEEVTSVIAKMTDEGGKFYDFQAKMAETLKVQLANLTLAWNNMLNAMGEESQGVLVGGISTLKQVFLHWKDIEHVLYELVVALGAYKAYQIITTRLMGATAASLDAQVLAMKRNKAAMLEKQALTRKLTIDELRQVAAQNQVTAADYRNALSGKQLTKQKALLLAALYKNNVQLKAALVNMGLLATTEAASITRGKALAIVFKSIGISIRNAALAIKSFMMSNWLMFAIAGAYELVHAYTSANEHIEEINKQAVEHAKEAFDNIKQYLESDVTSALRDRLAGGGKVENDAAGQKAWDEMREKIELSSSASNAFIAKLMQINDINARLSAGFGYLDDIQRVAGVMQTLEKDAVDVSSTSLGGLFGEGLKDDLEDFISSYEKYISLSEELKQTGVGEKYFNDIKDSLEELRGEIEETTTSLYNIASREGFNTNEQREFFEREISEIAQAEQMGAKETRIFRMQAEKEYYAYARAQLVAQLEYQQGAQKAATEKRIKDLDNEFGTNKAMQESFFTWLTEKQDNAVKNMLRGKTQEEIKQGEWLKGSNAKWVEEMARKFSKEYNVSFDDLRRLVLQANTWSVNIPVFFQTIGQPLSDVQRDYEARTGKKFSSNPLIKDAKTQVDIIDTLKKKQKEVANEMETARKAGGKYWEDNKQRYKEENDALVADIHAYHALTDAEEKANKKKSKGSKKDPLLDALKQEISLVEKLQSDYDKLSKSGASQADALDTIRGAYGKTIRLLNAQLGNYGLPRLDISQLITGKDPNKALAHFKQTLNTLVSKGLLTLERSKELEAVVEKFTLSAKTYNLDMITKGLNNELGKLKDEYELAVELDADPELGNAFANMMGIDPESLPHTVKEYADRYSTYLNKYLKGKDSSLQFTGDELRGLTRDDITAFREKVDAGSFNQEWFDAILKAYEDISGKRKKDLEETEKWKNSLIEKYGNLQDKLTKIYKDSVQNQVNAVKTFGTEGQKSDIVRLQLRLEATDNPAELSEINTEIAKIVKDVTDKNPIALKLVTASGNQTKADASKAYWEDFKNSELYAMTFEDMANNSTRAIQLIMDKLEGLKDKVKEDPASMKALMKSLEDAEKELNTRDPFGGIARSLRDMSAASQETKAAQEALWRAEVDVEQAQQEVDNSEDGTPEEQAAAQQKLADAIQRRAAAQVKLTQAENKGKKAQENLKSSLQGISNQLGNVQELFGVVSKLFRAGGDDETADAIDAISEGFSVMTTVIMGVVAAMILLESSQPWLLAIAAALSVIVGLVSFLSGNENRKIDAKIKDSELAVKRLENTYKNLEFAIENAYGANVIGAKQAAIANKELQLAELRRQLALEKSRDSKYRDEEKIVQLEGQIVDLQNDIKRSSQEVATELLGISSVGDAALSFMDAYISALRKGEDAQAAFTGSWKEMIANMIKQLWVTKVIGPQLEELVDEMNERLKSRSKVEAKAYANAVNELTRRQTLSDDDIRRELITGEYNRWVQEDLFPNGGWNTILMAEKWRQLWVSVTQEQIDAYREDAGKNVKNAQKQLNKATTPTIEDLSLVADAGETLIPMLEASNGAINAMLERFGLLDETESSLSALQQGIQGITEDTAGALEAYMNGVSQQVYYQSDLLTQIRDTLVGLDMDVQMATQAQMLLQLQQSYQVQMSIESILQGVLNPTGRAFSVELIS